MLRVIGLIELFVRCRKLLKTIRQEEERLQRMEQRYAHTTDRKSVV